MPKPRQSTVLIYDGDDFERLAELRRQVALAESAERTAEAAGTARAGDDASSEVQERRDAFDAFVEEAATRAEEWVLHPIGWQEFRDLLAEHPPRKEVDDDGAEQVIEEDAPFGVNTETFPKALLTFVDEDDDEIRTIGKPEFATDKERARRLKRLSEGEFETLWVRAWGLNRGVIADPKLSIYSLGSQTSSET